MSAPKTPPYRIACALCEAKPDERCKNPDGALRQWAHDKRVIDASRSQPEPERP
ncbi:hypothetical protein [Frondihabitans sp. VKM Ac-2883]|uniref:zinc finger domain-containing protein n=1 Tax=Frondihabitans sp. VKM Ac-2883 TaxID=2783823 RepID=UPI00188D4FAF|nr:hypothetical protein [Frondihabitans sp. VKM Ac-2883]MBF4574708.1 hypothetical protein [Frondihabitans sp. VKM Ac-2883]